MRGGYRVLDFRNRPPLPAFAPLLRLERELLGTPLKRFALECRFRYLTKAVRPVVNPGAATMTPSMQAQDSAEGLRLWWEEIDATGIDAVVCTGRLSDDRGSMDSAQLGQLQLEHPGRFFGLAPVDLDEAPGKIVSACEHSVRELGLRAINIEPAIRRRRLGRRRLAPAAVSAAGRARGCSQASGSPARRRHETEGQGGPGDRRWRRARQGHRDRAGEGGRARGRLRRRHGGAAGRGASDPGLRRALPGAAMRRVIEHGRRPHVRRDRDAMRDGPRSGEQRRPRSGPP